MTLSVRNNTIIDAVTPEEVTGASSVKNGFGFPTDGDYLEALRGVKRYEVWRRMMLSDGFCQAIVNAFTLPLMRVKWSLEGGNDALREESEFIWHNWRSYLRRALLFIPYGAFGFEQVFEVVGGSTVESAILPRPPWTWDDIRYTKDGELLEIRQRYGTLSGVIPANRLVIYQIEDDTEGVGGRSIFRGAYKHFDIASHLELIDSVGHENSALGIPHAVLADGADDTVRNKISNLLSNIRAGDNAYLVTDESVVRRFEVIFNNYKNAEIITSIEYHRRAMLVSTLTQFLLLGQNGVGSYSLSRDQTELFMLAVEGMAQTFAEQTVNQRIRRVLELNHTDIDPADLPELKWTGMDGTSQESIANMMASVSQWITPTPETENWLRDLMGAPTLDEAQHAPKKPDAPTRQLSDGPKFWREPTELERVVQLADLADELDVRADRVKSKLNAAVAAHIRRLGAVTQKALSADREDFAKLASLRPPPASVQAYESAQLADFWKDYEQSAARVVREVNAQGGDMTTAVLNSDIADAARKTDRAKVLAAAAGYANDLASQVTSEYRQVAQGFAADLTLTPDEVVEKTESALRGRGLASRTISNIAGFAAGDPMQLGAALAGKSGGASGDIEYGIYSALLDSGTCGPCRELDGEIIDVKTLTPACPNPDCLGRKRCRCRPIWVPKV